MWPAWCNVSKKRLVVYEARYTKTTATSQKGTFPSARLCKTLFIVAPFVTTSRTLHCLTQICGSNDGSNLFSQVQELGLQVAYSEDQGTYGWIRKLLALPFLPYTEITQFERLRLGAEGPRKDLAQCIA